MRAYVVKTMAHADPDLPGSDALAEALLLPLTKWKDTPSRSSREDGGDALAGGSSGG